MTHHPAPIRSDEGPPPPPPPLPPGRSPTIRRSPPVRPAPAAQVARNGRAQYGGGGPWGARQTQTGRQKQTGRQAHDARRRGAWTRFRRRGGLGCRRYAGLLSTRRAPSCGHGTGQRVRGRQRVARRRVLTPKPLLDAVPSHKPCLCTLGDSGLLDPPCEGRYERVWTFALSNRVPYLS